MQSTQITVGTRYAWNLYGSQSGRHKPTLGHSGLVQVTVLTEPKNGAVNLKTHDGRGNPSRTYEGVGIRTLLGTWEEHLAIAAARDEERNESIARHRAASARVAELVGPKAAKRHAHLIDFEVCGDGSYSTTVRTDLNTLASLVEAAYEQGKAAR